MAIVKTPLLELRFDRWPASAGEIVSLDSLQYYSVFCGQIDCREAGGEHT